MLASAETRWFFEGSPPPEFERWFRRGDLLYQAPRREDHYLIFPTATAVGVKFREGRLEIKALVQHLGSCHFAADVSGYVQVWEKWSGIEPKGAAFDLLPRSDPTRWATVGKERVLRKFSLTNETPTEVQAAATFPTDGCNVELTRIMVHGTVYWSFNLEAYGDPTRVEGSLKRAAERILADAARPRTFPSHHSRDDSLSLQRSFSYPEWLQHLTKHA